MKTKLLLIFLAFTVQVSAVNQYNFSKSTQTYSELTGATVLAQGINVQEFYTSITLPFNFYIAGLTTTQLDMDDLGIFSFGSTSEHIISLIGTTLIYRNTGTCSISTKSTGNNGSRVFKIEYKNLGFSTGDVGDYCNFQLWLYEGTNVVEVHFGTSNLANIMDIFDGQSGPQMGIISVTFPEYMGLLSGTPASATFQEYSSLTGNSTLNGFPSTNTVYKFTPSVVNSIKSLNNSLNIQLYPSPAQNKLVVKSEYVVETIEVFNLLGTQVLQQNIDLKSTELDITSLVTGTYILQLRSNGMVARRQFIKL